MEINICLYGASGHGKVIIDILKSNNIAVDFIIDDNPKVTNILNVEVIHSKEVIDLSNKKIIVSIGNNQIRKTIVNKFKAQFYKTIHKKAIVSEYSKIGEGSVVMAGAIINADVAIGKHCIVNSGAVIEHDCHINDFVHISPSASLAGNVKIGEGTHIGIGATIIQGIKIGKWVVVGAGTVIIRDVPDYAVVVGNPGKIIKYNTK